MRHGGQGVAYRKRDCRNIWPQIDTGLLHILEKLDGCGECGAGSFPELMASGPVFENPAHEKARLIVTDTNLL